MLESMLVNVARLLETIYLIELSSTIVKMKISV